MGRNNSVSEQLELDLLVTVTKSIHEWARIQEQVDRQRLRLIDWHATAESFRGGVSDITFDKLHKRIVIT